MGFRFRHTEIAAVKPHGHILVCDQCGESLNAGQPAVAISQWRGPGDMLYWENQYSG